MNDDITAIRRLKRGEIGGLETLVSRYQVRAMRTAFLITHDTASAEDVTQETFLRIFQHIQGFDETRPFEPYLLRSIVNAALDSVQKNSRFSGDLESLEETQLETLFAHARSVETQAEFNVAKKELHAALGKLSPRQRAAVVMRYYLDMSEKEMSESLDAAPGTIKWLLNAARERLRSLLGERSSL